MLTISQCSRGNHAAFFPIASRTRSVDVLQQRFEQSSLRRIEPKEFLFTEGDAATHLYRIETGAVILFKVLAVGRRQVMGFGYPGDLVGLGTAGLHDMNAQAIKPTRQRCLPVTALRQLADADPALAIRLYETLARELQATRDLLLTTGQRSALERVAGFLLALSQRNDRDGKASDNFELPMTRTDIGDFLGLTIETVSRAFTKLKGAELIEVNRNHQVRLARVRQLERVANGEPISAVHGLRTSSYAGA